MTSVNFSNDPALPPPASVAPISSSALKVSHRDRTTASLAAMLVFVGICVLMLFIIWVTTRVWIRNTAVAPELIEALAGGGNALGDARELVEPGEDELVDFAEPQLESTIDSITDAVTDQLATLDTMGGDAPSTTAGGGAGDSRSPGPGDGESNLVPRWQRWEVEFSAASSQLYAVQLDAFGIELAATGGGGSQIDYVSQLTSARPTRRSGASSADQRLYMTYRFGPLRSLDAALLQRAGVKTRGRIVMQFYPPATENLLAVAEQQYLKSNNVPLVQVKKTTFGVRSAGGRYEFYVKEQQLRRVSMSD